MVRLSTIVCRTIPFDAELIVSYASEYDNVRNLPKS